ncbi:MAG TPA: hypothetical protein VGQ51_01960 [Puia sp.]|jgi:hypothetical protein|nr:hypothetical protein [Puia sp.]
MMRSLLLAGIGLGFCLSIHAQIPDSSLQQSAQFKLPPAQQAARQVKNLEKKLRLTPDQVLQLQVILINRDVAMDSARNNPSGNHRTEAHTRRGIMQQADRQIDAMLTDDQKALYQQWKQQQKEQAKRRRRLNTSTPPQP